MTRIMTTDPATGRIADTGLEASTERDVAAAAEAAVTAFAVLRASDRAWRSGLLRRIADELAAASPELVAAALAETGLPEPRLKGELDRAVFQFLLFAEAVDEGGYLEAAIDHAADTPLGPAPDVRRLLVPIGPVAVFGASNFPFAFSVPGGDTASALAAGNPVIAKAHPAHPLTSLGAFRAIQAALGAMGAPEGSVGIVFGTSAGLDLVKAPAVQAVGFTGSLRGARALMAAIDEREQPIPFYGELSSINPLVVTEAAAVARGETIADGLVASFTGSVGQLCTKPGVAFVPEQAAALVDRLIAATAAVESSPMLTAGILEAFGTGTEVLAGAPGVRRLAGRAGEPLRVSPVVFEVDAADAARLRLEEVFGPQLLLVRYRDLDEVTGILRRMPASLTVSIHAEAEDDERIRPLLEVATASAGRIVFDGYPTGVRVSWAQHHGGPWPATNTLHTSVGVTAMRRFLRPLAWQNAPQSLLPAELRDGYRSIPRRVDGVLEPASGSPA